MTEQQAISAATEAAIESAFDGRWGVWCSDTGWWWATRTNALTAEELANGCAPFIHADNPDELHEPPSSLRKTGERAGQRTCDPADAPGCG